MARFYVKKNDKWNIFSSIADGFLYSDFMPFEELQAVVIGETVVDKMKDLGTLLTSNPRLNTMSYEEAEEHIRARRLADAYEKGDECGRCFGASFNDCERCRGLVPDPDCQWT